MAKFNPHVTEIPTRLNLTSEQFKNLENVADREFDQELRSSIEAAVLDYWQWGLPDVSRPNITPVKKLAEETLSATEKYLSKLQPLQEIETVESQALSARLPSAQEAIAKARELRRELDKTIRYCTDIASKGRVRNSFRDSFLHELKTIFDAAGDAGTIWFKREEDEKVSEFVAFVSATEQLLPQQLRSATLEGLTKDLQRALSGSE